MLIISNYRTDVIFNEFVSGGGTLAKNIGIDADTIMVSLYVQDLVGSLDVKVKTYSTSENRYLDVITFPTIVSNTDTLIIKKAATILKNAIVEVTYSDSCTFEIMGKGISIGESSVRILGANSGKTSKKIISTTPQKVIPASLDSRVGMTVRFYDPSQTATNTVFYSFTEDTCTVDDGFPLFPNDVSSIDIGAGVDLWARTNTGDADIRILEGGS